MDLRVVRNKMNWLKENWFKISVVTLLLLAILFVAFYFFAFIPSRDNARLAEIEFQEMLNQAELETCLKESALQRSYDHMWKCASLERAPSHCEAFGGAKTGGQVADNFLTFYDMDIVRLSAEEYQDLVESCNCGLESLYTDDLDTDKDQRDDMCLVLHNI